jgi:uncharacterized repeat protein (TIGR03803 family)
MQSKKCSTGLTAALTVLTVTLLMLAPRAVAQEKVLYDFNLNKYGATPQGGLITDTAGNLYGTASEGGPSNYTGTVFEFSPKADGGWKYTVLHSFSDANSVKGGAEPYAGLISDATGNLYGTTHIGGKYGYGTLFELVKPTTGTTWKFELLHSFDDNGTDGVNPAFASLVLDAAGNLYGTTPSGGANSAGIVFELVKPTAGTTWKEKILHTFDNPVDGTDGATPSAGLAFDSKGNLYGTTTYGDTNGLYNAGTVFELSPTLSGGWNYVGVLHNFSNDTGDGSEPGYGSLLYDASTGVFYGTTIGGGANNLGTVFALSPNESGGWNESVLYSFGSYSTDGVFPYSGLTLDTLGNLYGTTSQGGAGGGTGIGPGTVFELSPNGSEGWSETLLHSFTNNGTDGFEPYAGVVLDAFTGNLYGTTPGGGTYAYGTVYEVTP